MLVIWDFKLHSSPCDDDSDESSSHSSELVPSEEHSDPEAATSFHTVTFKVIGCTREARYQRVLRDAKNLLDQDVYVDVKLHPEPDNPFGRDPEAII